MNTGIIFDIKRFAVHDGPGIRTTVFFKGCHANCWWCHNPESQQLAPHKTVQPREIDGCHFEDEKMLGREMDVRAVFNEIVKDRIYFEESGGGVTFSGGEPLMQPAFLKSLLKLCKNNGLHTTLDTTGYAKESVFRSVLPLTDLLLFDLKIMDTELHLKYTGVSNELILKNLQTSVAAGKKVIIRFPFIPGINSDGRNIDAMVNFLCQFDSAIREIHVLPFHKIAAHKYKRLGIENKMVAVSEPDKKQVLAVQSRLESAGFRVK